MLSGPFPYASNPVLFLVLRKQEHEDEEEEEDGAQGIRKRHSRLKNRIYFIKRSQHFINGLIKTLEARLPKNRL
jgi:hypothetical protein